MAMKLHGVMLSTCTKRVAIALEELEVPYEVQEVNILKGAHKDPEFAKLQPFSMIPVLEDPELGVPIFESRAIVRYLANKYPEKGLAGTDAKSRALCDNWMEAEAQNLNPYTEGLTMQRVFVPMHGGTPDEAKIKDALAGLEQKLAVLDKHLASNEYLAGNSFSIADISAMPYMRMVMTKAGEADLVARFPNVQAWAERIFSRKSWKTVEERGQLPA